MVGKPGAGGYKDKGDEGAGGESDSARISAAVVCAGLRLGAEVSNRMGYMPWLVLARPL